MAVLLFSFHTYSIVNDQLKININKKVGFFNFELLLGYKARNHARKLLGKMAQ